MSIDHELPPVPPFKTGKWLLGVFMTTAIVGGIFGALTILFIPEGLFDMGPDNTVRGRGLKEVDERIIRLEQDMARVQPQAGPDMQILQANVDNALTETRALQQKVATIQNDGQHDGQLANIIVGLTQLKTAYENDEPLNVGIETLKKNFSDGPVADTLNQLAAATRENFTSKDGLLAQVQDIRQVESAGSPAVPPAATPDMTWQERAKRALNQFVKVQPTAAIERKGLLALLAQAINGDDFKTATELASRLPDTIANKKLLAELETRLTVQKLVQKSTSLVSQALGNVAGSMY